MNSSVGRRGSKSDSSDSGAADAVVVSTDVTVGSGGGSCDGAFGAKFSSISIY